MFQTVVAVGSNINPDENVMRAETILKKEHHFLGKSQFIKTKPVGYQNQADFLNGAFFIKTDLDKNEFNAYLKEVEKRLGRVKGPIKSGPRNIDLDIIIWSNKIVDDDFYSKNYITIPVQELIDTFHIWL